MRPLGQSLIGKQQLFVSPAIYASRAGQAVSASGVAKFTAFQISATVSNLTSHFI